MLPSVYREVKRNFLKNKQLSLNNELPVIHNLLFYSKPCFLNAAPWIFLKKPAVKQQRYRMAFFNGM